jgi:hypothetical protein
VASKDLGVMRPYHINIIGNEDGSFSVEYFYPPAAYTPGEKLSTTFRVWGLSVIRATPELMKAAGFEEEQ